MALILVRPAGAFFAGAARAGLTLELASPSAHPRCSPGSARDRSGALRDAAGRSLGKSWTRKLKLVNGVRDKIVTWSRQNVGAASAALFALTAEIKLRANFRIAKRCSAYETLPSAARGRNSRI